MGKDFVSVTSNPEGDINSDLDGITLVVICHCLVNISKSGSSKLIVTNIQHSNMDTRSPMQFFNDKEEMRRLQVESQVMERLMREEQPDVASQ